MKKKQKTKKMVASFNMKNKNDGVLDKLKRVENRVYQLKRLT